MRAIRKLGSGGFHLTQAHTHPPETSEQATTRWNSFRRHKAAVLQCLLEEQFQLCCYSELRADEEGLGYHIEHVENKSQKPSRTFDYSNLAASALDSANDLHDMRFQGKVVFGGHASDKQTACDMQRFVSPHRPDCHRFFAYLSDGRVVPSTDLNAAEQDQAQYTVDLLNLNSPFLVTRRQQWWDELDRLYEEHRQKHWSLSDLAAIDLVPVNGRLSLFFSVTRQFFGPVAEQTLRDCASAFP
ncbi:MAG: retron system putative HNH endonuclease [Methyloversatilis sp.]|uniref:retron system putative HNH endonuclease n=1 Tax=Methyloversatilis sp. TaxID=2569862 RepID=UPI0027337491|nr:retron system putative HNH endonuclease [Methyloversatilis sp.]MDP3873547.1 retron system putative HNH endonuclease [Methyloversatilis sp.]